MVSALDYALLIILFAYIAIFLIAVVSKGSLYLKSRPADRKNPDGTRDEIAEFERSETISHTLAGFALAALTFIIAFNQDLKAIEILITFFSLSLIFEIASSLFYRHAYSRAYKYLGFVFQYAGLLAIINGFFAFLIDAVQDSYLFWIVYSAGLVLFFILTGRELKLYLDYWKNL